MALLYSPSGLWPCMKNSLFQTIATRLVYAVPVVFLVATGVFFLIHLVPGDPVEQMLGERAQTTEMEELRHTLGLDRPVGEQYLNYLKNAAAGNLGTSFRFNAPVTSLILSRGQRGGIPLCCGCSHNGLATVAPPLAVSWGNLSGQEINPAGEESGSSSRW